MQTIKQILIQRMQRHGIECQSCGQQRSASRGCPIGAALLSTYHACDSSDPNTFLQVAGSLHWDILALASLRVDEEPNIEWQICVDTVIAQKVEFLWALSEAYWLRNTTYARPFSH